MPRYFFHLRTPTGIDIDRKGMELRDAEAAYLLAAETIPAMSVAFTDIIADARRFRIEITDDLGRILFEIPFAEILG
ncbi:hypothetical protein U8607_02515 [Methylobacterium durans]|uniref:DUF6894 family protein n=1 Tax=Methylobacterium durans TaxID=2202825 RepID=UPI002AFFF26B|nr:hypothetical protein [Methylobacterium durans]MEA1830944.1 hypothetical protein [Methylobacterium durans]